MSEPLLASHYSVTCQSREAGLTTQSPPLWVDAATFSRVEDLESKLANWFGTWEARAVEAVQHEYRQVQMELKATLAVLVDHGGLC